MAAFSWDSPTWGKPGHNVHIGTTVADRHDAAEEAAEAGRG
jgi:hypothetical protein